MTPPAVGRVAAGLALLGLTLAGAGAVESARAQGGAAGPHGRGELECKNCHVGKHVGVVSMYLGMGGHGAPVIPSHMLQVRVECVACHVTPKEEAGKARLVGQTFRPTEQACLGCHGEKYRGMLERWVGTLARMQALVAPKLAGARAALAGADAGNPRHARARTLVDDAEANTRFVTFGKGVHNVFYAADLLKVSNGWLDESFALLGKAPVQTDDALVRGGYCGVLCHEQAGVKPRETVTFGKQKIPHGRHVTELGATCTACHSSETHKAVTATAATCASCHHGPQNDRCESCHRAQAAFYRGTARTDLARVEPNVMAEAVPCTGCHDFAAKHSRQAVGQKCLTCHEAPYLALMAEWTAGFDKDVSRATAALRRADSALANARRARRPVGEAETLVKSARDALALVRTAKVAHNPLAADALLEAARQRAEAAIARLARP